MLQRQSNQAVVISSTSIIWRQRASDDNTLPANRRPGSLRPSGATLKRCLWQEAGENKAESVCLKVSWKHLKENILDSSDPKCSASSPRWKLLLSPVYLAEYWSPFSYSIYSSLPFSPLIELRNSPDLLLPLQAFGLDRHWVPFVISNTCNHQWWCFLQLHGDHAQITCCSRWQLWAGKMLARADQSNLDNVLLLKNHVCKKMHRFSERNHQGSLLDSGLNFVWKSVTVGEKELWNSRLSGIAGFQESIQTFPFLLINQLFSNISFSLF